MKKMLLFVVSLVLLIPIVSWTGVRIYKAYDFSISCTGHLKRAADANTIELAKEEMTTAIKYLEANNLTHGYVSIFLKQPENDIGFWYKNLKSSLDELDKVNDNATQLEKSNVLMKLRETLLDATDKGTSVTIPNGISIYPNNVFYFWLCIAGIIFLIGSRCIWGYMAME